MKKLALIIALLLPGAALAQQGQAGYSGFSLTSPLDISAGQDQHFLVNRTPVNEQLLILSLPAGVMPGAPDIYPVPLTDNALLIEAPTVAFTSNSHRTDLAITYQPEFEFYQVNRDQDAWNHNAQLHFAYKLGRQWTLTAGDQFISSNDPSRTLQNVLLMLPLTRFRENALTTGITFDQSTRTSYTFHYDSTVNLFGENSPLIPSDLNTTAQAFSFTGSHMLTRNQVLRGTVMQFTTAPINRQSIGNSEVNTSAVVGFKNAAHGATAEYMIDINHGLRLDFTGGALNSDLGLNYIYSGAVDKRLGENWVGGGYTHSLAFFDTGTSGLPNPLAASSFYDTIQLHWRGQPTDNIAVHAEADASRATEAEYIGSAQNLMGKARVDYRWTDRVVTFFQAETYRQNRNVYINAPLARNRFFAGIEYSFSSESERRTSSMNRDADNVALTSHGRQRAQNQ